MSAFANPYLIPELIMNPVPEPGEPPKTKVMVHGLPGSKFTRQHAPTDAAFEHIKDGIRNLAQINSPLSSFGFRCWKQRLNQRPLRRRQIARIGKLIHPTTILHAFSDRFLGISYLLEPLQGSRGSWGSTIFGTPPTKSPALKNDSRFRSGRFSNGPSVWRYNSSCGSLNWYARNFRD